MSQECYMNVKVLLIFCDTSVTVQPRLTFADAPSEGPVPTQKRTKGKIIVHFKPLFQQSQYISRACPSRFKSKLYRPTVAPVHLLLQSTRMSKPGQTPPRGLHLMLMQKPAGDTAAISVTVPSSFATLFILVLQRDTRLTFSFEVKESASD